MNTQFLYDKKYWIAGAIAFVIGISAIFSYSAIFGAPQKTTDAEPIRFSSPLGRSTAETIGSLKENGYIKSEWGFRIALRGREIEPGGYRIAQNMTAWELARALKEPYMKWVVIPEGLRKEQTADIIGEVFGWSEEQKKEFVTKHTAMKLDEIEGVYFPDTYLIPTADRPIDIASRLRAKFNDEFKPYADEALKQNIKWTTLLKLASIVQREAAGKNDMPLIAGILWNRLLKDMKLEVDATIQYVRDDKLHYGEARYMNQPTSYTSEGSWWTPIKPEDKNIESPYNTYRNKGLPPGAIASPGVDAIKAVLHPEETECLYYLHDQSKAIHCAKTFEEHEANIASYLR